MEISVNIPTVSQRSMEMPEVDEDGQRTLGSEIIANYPVETSKMALYCK